MITERLNFWHASWSRFYHRFKEFFSLILILWSGESSDCSSLLLAALYHAHLYLHFTKFPKKFPTRKNWGLSLIYARSLISQRNFRPLRLICKRYKSAWVAIMLLHICRKQVNLIFQFSKLQFMHSLNGLKLEWSSLLKSSDLTQWTI